MHEAKKLRILPDKTILYRRKNLTDRSIRFPEWSKYISLQKRILYRRRTKLRQRSPFLFLLLQDVLINNGTVPYNYKRKIWSENAILSSSSSSTSHSMNQRGSFQLRRGGQNPFKLKWTISFISLFFIIWYSTRKNWFFVQTLRCSPVQTDRVPMARRGNRNQRRTYASKLSDTASNRGEQIMRP